ncbi:MAG: proliferating cell nuclear antigen (pcna) [Nanoarchaeota archaeon]|nr:proliferating cell nuclear antigen (pcna) [Nanoarchaeota archaeon]
MKARIENPKFFSEVISLISELVTEVKLKFNDGGMSITAVDPATVALVSFKLPKEGFSEYEAGNEVLGVNLDNFKAILRRAKTSSSLIMESTEGVLNLEVVDRVKRKFSLALIEVDGEDREMPSLEFLSQIQISPKDFMDAVEDCLIVSDSCTFIAEPEKFVVEASGLNSARAEFSSDEIKIISGESKARYSLEYLQKFMKAGKLTDKVFINFSNDHPLKLEFKTDTFQLAFVLAPRVENDD